MSRSLGDFEGRWRIGRRIEDRAAGGSATFDGMARFSRDTGGLAYEESGELRLPAGDVLQAGRRYLWCAGEDGAIEVRFADGSDFHRIETGADVVTAWHDCMPDTYEVSYNFTRWPEWRAIWRVTGPAKDYTLITDYRRA